MSNEKKPKSRQQQIQMLLQHKQSLLQAKQRLSQKLQATSKPSPEQQSE